jgi:DNA-binding NarL/FixJ family response regulator
MRGAARLLLADDHPMMCDGLRSILEPAYQIVGIVHDGREVSDAIDRFEPDLVLLDISLPGMNGLELARSLKRSHPDLKTMILTMHSDRLYADEAIRAGALGFVVKLASGSELRFAVGEVLAGRTYVTPLVSASGATAAREVSEAGDGSGSGHALTPRQLDVLRLLARGAATPEIAQELGVSVKAVEFHRARLKRALGLSSNAALVRFAVAKGIV